MYFTLVKLFLKENISIKRLMGFDVKASKTKAILIGIAIIYALLVFIGAFGYMFFDLGRVLNDIGQSEILISFLSIYTLGMSLFITLFRASGYLFYYKDYELLSPLPIHPKKVLYAKMTVLLIMLYMTSFIFTLPIIFSYFYWQGVNLLSILYFIIGFLFIPLIPVAIFSFLSLGIAILTAKLRYAKLLSIVFVLALMVGIFMLSFQINEVETNPLTGQIDLFKGIASIYLPFDWFRRAVHEASILHLAYLVLSNGAIFGLYLFLIQGLVHRTNQKGIRSNIRKSVGPIKYQERPAIFAIVHKEMKRFFSSTLYALNTGFGPVILLVASVASLFFKSELENILSQAMGMGGLSIEVMVLTLIGFTLAMTYTPAISLSLEGKNFWIIKSLPIKAKTVMYGKILFNLFVGVPIGLLAVILFGFSLQLPVINQVLMLLLVIVYSLVISCFDAMINLLMPKFNFVNDAEVIKQSAGALLATFGGFAILAISGVAFYLLNDKLDLSLILLVLVGINLILLTPLVIFLEKKTDAIFNKLHA